MRALITSKNVLGRLVGSLRGETQTLNAENKTLKSEAENRRRDLQAHRLDVKRLSEALDKKTRECDELANDYEELLRGKMTSSPTARRVSFSPSPEASRGDTAEVRRGDATGSTLPAVLGSRPLKRKTQTLANIANFVHNKDKKRKHAAASSASSHSGGIFHNGKTQVRLTGDPANTGRVTLT